MKLLVICIFQGLALFSNAQANIQSNYLLVRFDQSYDNTNKRFYYSINAESGCDSAKEFYALLKYDNQKNAKNTDGFFYSNQKSGTLDNLYNYFYTPTEAINFISLKGWGLFSIYSEIFSGYDNQKSGNGEIQPITTVSSRSVFCFKK